MREQYLTTLREKNIPFNCNKQSVLILNFRVCGDMVSSELPTNLKDCDVKLYKELNLCDINKTKSTSIFKHNRIYLRDFDKFYFDKRICVAVNGHALNFVPFITQKELLFEFKWLYISLKDLNGKVYNILLEIQFHNDYNNEINEGLIYIQNIFLNCFHNEDNNNLFALSVGKDGFDVTLIDSISDDNNLFYLSNRKIVFEGLTNRDYFTWVNIAA